MYSLYHKYQRECPPGAIWREANFYTPGACIEFFCSHLVVPMYENMGARLAVASAIENRTFATLKGQPTG